MTKPLTDVAIRKAAAGSTRRHIRDAGMRSLFLIVETSGRKSFQMRFRTPTGRIAKLTLGPYVDGAEVKGQPEIGMPLTLAAARSLAADIHRQRAQGVDVIADRQAAKVRQRVETTTRTVTGFAGNVQSYIDDYARKNIRDWRETARMLGLQYDFEPSPKSEPEVIKNGLCNLWADKPVTDIDQANIQAVIIEARRIAIPGIVPRNTGRSEARARKLLVALSALFGWLHTEGLVKNNPCRDVARPENGEPRDRVLTADEVRWFWQAADMERGAYGPLLKLLLLTGARLDEVAGMRRDELSDDGATWNLPGSRTKNGRPHIVPLPPMARDLINSSRSGNNFVFTTTGTSPVSGWSRLKHRIDANMRAIAGQDIPDWRLHDLRRTFVTGCGELGIAPHVIELCVNHISGSRGGIAGTYNKSVMLPERKTALERWAVHVVQLVSSADKGGDVIPMKRTK